MTALLGRSGAKSALANDAECFEDIGMPLMFLYQLAMEPSLTLRIRSENLASLFGLVCWATDHVVKSERQVEKFHALVMLLASVTPAEIQPLMLPPTKKVFNRAKTEPVVRNAYEFLRSWRSDATPALPVIYAQALWEALSQIPKPNDQLMSLRANLDNETLLFRWAKETFETSNTPGSREKRLK